MTADRKAPYLDTERLAAIFEEKIIHPQCPFCDCEEWELPLPDNTTGVSLPWGRGTNFVLSGTPAVMLYCKNCGFVRLHSLRALNGVLVEPDVITIGPAPAEGEA